MFGRPLRVIMLAGLCLWFGVIVPGHQRGRITLPGSRPSAMVACQAMATSHSCHNGADPRGGDDPSAPCAVCMLIATLDAPPVADLTAPKAELVELLIVLAPQRPATCPRTSTHLGRAPPAFA